MKIVIVLLVVEAKCGVFESTWKCILGNKFNYFKPNKLFVAYGVAYLLLLSLFTLFLQLFAFNYNPLIVLTKLSYQVLFQSVQSTNFVLK